MPTWQNLPLLIVFAIGPEGQYLQRSYAIDDRDEKTAYGSIEKKNLDAEFAKKQWKKVTVAGAVGGGGY